MNTANELERWLRKEANERLQRSESRRSGARLMANLSDEDLRSAHRLAEQMSGRKLSKQSRAQREENSKIEERIASKLDKEAEMLFRFADFVAKGS